MDSFALHRGNAPLLISLPHDGTAVPPDIAAQLTDSARKVPDTDWHVARLYGFARELGASILVPSYSRYVVDLNRGDDDVSLYPGQNTTGLCPTRQFSGEAVYLDGQRPSPQDIRHRVERYWRPYHAALSAELARVHAQHGRVVLWEGHSIRSVVPFLFEGRLPDFNLGTADGASCSPELQQRLTHVLESQSHYGFIVNGRFKGGHITRHYADLAHGVEAVQLELSQRTYMDEDSQEYQPGLAQPTQQLIRRMLECCLR